MDDSVAQTPTVPTFSELILGFSSAALFYLGEGGVDGEVSADINLPLAAYNISIIELLLEKTKGNTSQEDNDLITQVLHDLRQTYDALSSK